MHSEHFKQSTNITGQIAPDSLVRLATCGGIISKPLILEHVQGKIARCAKTQTLFLQMSLSDVDPAHSWEILSMQTAVLSFLCYTKPLNNRIFMVDKKILRIPVSVTPIRISPIIKNLEFN